MNIDNHNNRNQYKVKRKKQKNKEKFVIQGIYVLNLIQGGTNGKHRQYNI